MKILFVSGLYPIQKIEELRKLSHNELQSAPNVYQWAVLEGLLKNEVDVEVISFPFLPCFPMKYSRIYTPDSDIFIGDIKVGKMLSYNAFVLCKQYSIANKLRMYLKHWLDHNYEKEQDIWILSYTPYSCFAKPIIELKNEYPRIKYCAIIADLVDDATNSSFDLSIPKRLQAIMEQKAVWASYEGIDKFVLLSKQMEEKIPYAKGKSIVVEGLVSNVDNESVNLKINDSKIVLYTGSLQDFTGVLDLVEAFRTTSDNTFKLVICGKGPLEHIIKSHSEEDSRIEYVGNIPREEAVLLQKQATILVNPRKPTNTLTRYSFPSKTMEYMASGTPMLGYKLEGIPEEYYEYMFIPKDLTRETLADSLNNILSLSPQELRAFGIKAKEFIREKKEASRQMHRLLQFLEA